MAVSVRKLDVEAFDVLFPCIQMSLGLPEVFENVLVVNLSVIFRPEKEAMHTFPERRPLEKTNHIISFIRFSNSYMSPLKTGVIWRSVEQNASRASFDPPHRESGGFPQWETDENRGLGRSNDPLRSIRTPLCGRKN